MKKAKKIASLVIASALLTSSFAAYVSVNAAETDSASVTESTESTLRDTVGEGVMLHAFNWSYNTIKENLPAIAAAGYTTVQTSPVQQPKDYTLSSDVANQWWKLYQPVSLQIAEKSWLGTKDELKSLCKEADKYGVKIICDIVSNHMGNETEDDSSSLSTQVQTYQPDIYSGKSDYFHTYSSDTNDNSIQAVVQGHLSNCPDLNTSSDYVQSLVVDLLEDCIDCGVDGFRFDAAKHIETPDDGTYASDYWSTITSEASAYYKDKTGGDLYIYGEILNTCGSTRQYSSYTKYINVTDNRTGDAVLYNVTKGNASSASSSTYKSGCSASDVVLWAESHDTYEGTSGSAGLSNTASVSDEDIVKAWALVASRKDSTALYFARPGSALMGEAGTDTTYKSTAVSEINKFHNLFVGESENLGYEGTVAYVVRGTSGIVLSNCSGTTASVSISGTGIADGTYTDTITGGKFTVSGGVLTGNIGSTGVAVVYSGSTTPRNTCSVESGSFSGDTMTVTLGLDNATSGTYCLDGSTPVTYTDTTTIRIGSDYETGDTITLTLTASDGTNSTTTVYKYEKEESDSSGVYVFFNSANKSSWKAPFTVYVYDEDTADDGTVYQNANWPGESMSYDEVTGLYYYEVPSTAALASYEDGSTETVSFDLAHSSNTRVILVTSTGTQYPGSTSKKTLDLGGSSKIYANTKTNSWEDTTLTPTPVEEEATDVTKGTTVVESTETTATEPTYTSEMLYGDIDGNGVIGIQDVTLVKKHIVGTTEIASGRQVLADVDQNNVISIIDATMIQRYVVGITGYGLTGSVYDPEQTGTTAQEESTTAVEPTTAEQPATEADETYTLYFKTKLAWMTSDGVSLFAYDTATGESYTFEQDTDAYPYVYTTEVPVSTTSVIVYRYLDMVDETPTGGDSGNVYNCWSAKPSKTNNCITLSNDEVVSVGEYVEETAPEFTLERVYFDNSLTNWSTVYIYGWSESGLGNSAVAMTQISGTDIWYYDFDNPLSPGSKCFLFKNTLSTWDKQTNDITVEDGKNCYRANAGSKSGGTWTTYTE